MASADGGRAERVGRRIRTARESRGWDAGELAERAGISRTTLHHLERGETGRPRASTLSAVAAALELSTVELCAHGDGSTEPAREAGGGFDRRTNVVVGEVFAERPEVFAGWTDREWDELYSTFGTGGGLNREGVFAEASRINRKRETFARLEVVLETHLAGVAEELVGVLYEAVSSSGDGSAASLSGMDAMLRDRAGD